MSDDLQIREERPGDEGAIRALTEAAFAEAARADGTEPAIIDALRDAGELALSLIGVENGDLVAQATFSRVLIDGAESGWFGLGPISVAPARQSRGLGGALIREGLKRLRERGAGGCVLIGDPAYYGRFGFKSSAALTYKGVPVQYVQQLALGEKTLAGELQYAPSFERAAAGGS